MLVRRFNFQLAPGAPPVCNPHTLHRLKQCFYAKYSLSISLFSPLYRMQVEMTTGATIHTTQGLKMTVTRRTQPPIIPNLEAKVVIFDSDQQQLSSNLLEATSVASSLAVAGEDQQGEVSATPVSWDADNDCERRSYGCPFQLIPCLALALASSCLCHTIFYCSTVRFSFSEMSTLFAV